jgi:hemolysin activation/secretion protein
MMPLALFAEIGLVTTEETVNYIQEQERILTHQRQQIQQHSTDLFQPPKLSVTTVNSQLLDTPLKDDQMGPSFFIKSIDVTGVTKLPYNKLQKILKPYRSNSISLSQIKILSNEIVNAYISKGYITTRVALPKQNLNEGVLKLSVVEGRVGKIYSTNFRLSRSEIVTAFPGVEGTVLQLKDLEQGLDQLNSNRSKSVTFQLVPSLVDGVTDVVVVNHSTLKRGSLNLNYNNYGIFEKGPEPDGISVGIENQLRLNEQLDMYFTNNNGEIGQTSRTRSFNLKIPFGYLTQTFSYSETDYHYRLHSRYRVINTSGQTFNRNWQINCVLSRAESYVLNAHVALNNQQVDGMVEDTLLDVGSSQLTVVRGGLSGFKQTAMGQWSFDVTHHQGVDEFDATIDLDNLSSESTHAQFQKWTTTLGFSRGLQFWKWPVYMTSSVSAQRANTALYSSEEMSVGGVYSIRGTSGTLNGENGVTVRNELTVTSQSALKLLKNASYTATLDGGYISTRDTYAVAKKGGAIGLTLGMRWSKPSSSMSLSYGIPLKLSSALEKNESKLYSSFTLSF